MPEVLEALAELKKDDRAAFEAMRVNLKRAGCRVTALDDAIAEETGEGGRGPSQADILLELAQAARCFTPRTAPVLPTSTSMAIGRPGQSGARVSSAGWRAASTRRPAGRRLRGDCGQPERDRGQGALRRAGTRRPCPGRRPDGKIYLDLCDAAWRAIEVDASGWRAIDEPAGQLPPRRPA